MTYTSIPDSIFTRQDITIDQKWFYTVLLHKCVQQPEPLICTVESLSRDPNIMLPPPLVQQHLAMLRRRGFIAFTEEDGLYRITVEEASA